MFITENHVLRPKKQKLKKEVPALLPEPFEASANRGYLSVFVLPFILHLGFMAATAFFIMHVQVWLFILFVLNILKIKFSKIIEK